MIVCAVARATPPVSTVTMAASPSAMVAGWTVRLKAASLSLMVRFLVPIATASWLAAIVIVSVPSASASSAVVMVALPEVASAAIVMLAGVIV